jgi:acetyl esterase/lipase
MRALAVTATLLATSCTGAMEAYFAQDVVEIERDIAYADINARQRLDLYMPRGAESVPVVVFVHGGFWIRQAKDFFQPFVGLYGNVGISLARRGIGVAVIDYRLVPAVTFDEEYADVATALAWVQDHVATRGGDPSRIVMAGHSAGGHMTALSAFDDTRLAAHGVDVSTIRGYAPLSPILDLAALAAHPPAENAEIVDQVFGDNLAPYSPRTHFKAQIAPMLIVLGDRDLESLKDQVPQAVDELVALGAPVEYHLLEGKDHDQIVIDFDTDDDPMTPLIVDFVRAVAP